MVPKFSVIIHNVRSIWNVGSIFRTADGAGVDFIWLTGYTPGPDNHPDKITKTSLGAEAMVPWRRRKQVGDVIKKLRKDGVRIIALEKVPGAKDYRKFKAEFPLALVVGNEVSGVSPDVARLCDMTIQLPMRGRKESLNVAVAFGIAAYDIMRRIR